MNNPRLFRMGTKPTGDAITDFFHGPGVEFASDITLRDLFAAFSLAGIRASDSGAEGIVANHPTFTIAKLAYADADAMLAERDAKKS